MRLFNAHMVEAIMDRLNLPEDLPIESKMVSRSIQSAQTQIEQQNFEIRKNVLKYDEVLNKQRIVIYAERRRVLAGEDLHESVRNMIDDTISAYVDGATSEGYPEDWDLDTLWTNLKALYPVSLSIEHLEEASGGLTSDYLIDELAADAQAAYDRREESLGSGPDEAPIMRDLERRVLLEVLDRKWREHLYEMDYLQEGVHLRGYGQRDPLVEYQREAFDMFTAMMDGIKEEAVGFLFYVQVNIEELSDDDEQVIEVQGDETATAAAPPQPIGAPQPEPHPLPSEEHERVADVIGRAIGGTQNRQSNLQYSAPSIDGDGDGGVAHSSAPAAGGGTFANASRNAPCPCGSGRKYKRCHGAPGTPSPS
jgi:preprotein translocase subunit SecA